MRESSAKRPTPDFALFLKATYEGSTAPGPEVQSIIDARHSDPHTILGAHSIQWNGVPATTVRGHFPGRQAANLVITGEPGSEERFLRLPMRRVHEGGMFEALLPRREGLRYHFEVKEPDGFARRVEDPYRFPVSVSDMDLWLFGEGTLGNVAELLGAHELRLDGTRGFNFVVWAPNAERVSVVGELNDWDGRTHPMRRLGSSGAWEIFVPDLPPDSSYKFEIAGRNGKVLLKSDPAARMSELRPNNSSRTVAKSTFKWQDADWMKKRAMTNWLERPVVTYEIHLPSWKRDEHGNFLNYREIADQIIPYAKEQSFTHIQLLGLLEHPYDGSWGYQVTGYFAPTSRHGSPDDFKYLVDKAHAAGVGVMFDWVPAHFPKDAHGLAEFDGTHLFDHEDDRLGEHRDWGTRIFNYRRNEVRAFLHGGLMHMLKEFHLDGDRVDAVASMLYRDYSRSEEEKKWIWETFKTNINDEAVEFLKTANGKVGTQLPGVMRIAEESTAFPGVTRSIEEGGLGFDTKWNMGWMNDTLRFFELPPSERAKELDVLTHTFTFAHSERYVCALSHDEVVHGKRSLLSKMPGDEWQKFANLRLLYGYMWSYPGHKLLFMGQEFGQWQEWNYEKGLEWNALLGDRHGGLRKLVSDLNKLYTTEPALHERQFEPDAIETFRDYENAVVGMLRKGRKREDDILFVHNLTPNPLGASSDREESYRIGVDFPGAYREVLNTDSRFYGGSDVGNMGQVEAEPVGPEEGEFNGKKYSIRVALPPLGSVAFKRVAGGEVRHG